MKINWFLFLYHQYIGQPQHGTEHIYKEKRDLGLSSIYLPHSIASIYLLNIVVIRFFLVLSISTMYGFIVLQSS
jgi:hypothetical protein